MKMFDPDDKGANRFVLIIFHTCHDTKGGESIDNPAVRAAETGRNGKMPEVAWPVKNALTEMTKRLTFAAKLCPWPGIMIERRKKPGGDHGFSL
jgi:hypothetical protein